MAPDPRAWGVSPWFLLQLLLIVVAGELCLYAGTALAFGVSAR